MEIATLFDSNFLVEGLVCIESALRRGAETVFALCLDREVEHRLFDKTERTVLIPLGDLEAFYRGLRALREARDWQSYADTLKPFFAGYLLEFYAVDEVTLVDSDMLFWGPVATVGQIMREHDAGVLVIDREYDNPLPSGRFNNGFVAANERGLPFLRWWQEQCTDRCEWMTKGPEGQFGGEGYLDVIHDEPDRFPEAKGIRHPGLNLAPWNLRFHTLSAQGSGLLVDGEVPLVCYHYRGFQNHEEPFDEEAPGPPEARELLHRPYYNLLLGAAERLQQSGS